MDLNGADSSVCAVCGMPLAYDRFMSAQGGSMLSADGTLCSYCADPKNRKTAPRGSEDNAWVLDLILDVYRSDGNIRRWLADLVTHVPVAPPKLRRLADVINRLPYKSPESRYDAVVLYSGGKDSSYMLLNLARRDLRLCAWMLNQGYQSPTAIENAKRLCQNLDVPLMIEAPDKLRMDKLFRLGFSITGSGDAELMRAAMTFGSACWPCFATIAARATSFCADNAVAFCFIGSQAGQNRLDLGGKAGLEGILPRTEDLLDKFVGPITELANREVPESAAILQRRPCRTVLLPFYEFVKKPDAADQIAALTQVGWTMPNNTGACSTNCMINELGRQVMRKRFGFDLYQIIDAHERRLGNKVSQTVEDLQQPELDHKAVRRGAKMIKLSAEEAREFGVEM